jgi:hypothetical protein
MKRKERRKQQKQHRHDYIVVKQLIKNCSTVYQHSLDKSNALYKEEEYTTEVLNLYPTINTLVVTQVSELSFEDCVKHLNEEISRELKHAKDKRRSNSFQRELDIKLLSIKLIRVKAIIEETEENSISYQSDECSSVIENDLMKTA